MTLDEEIAQTPAQPSESLLTRNFVEQVQRLMRMSEQQAREHRFAGERGFDISALPGGQGKAYRTPRDPATIDLIVVHVTGVRGGFGVQRWGETGWNRWLPVVKATQALYSKGRQVGEDWDLLGKVYGELLPDEIAEQLWRTEALFGDPLAIAKRVARWHRLLGTPYQQIGCPHAGEVLDNRPTSQRSWASGPGGNDGVAYASDCSHTETFDAWGIETCRAGLRRLHTRLIDARVKKHGPLAELPRISVVPHRATTFPGRAQDDGAWQWEHVVLPVCESTPNLVPDYEYRAHTGRPIPRSWDPAAHFDERGRRVK